MNLQKPLKAMLIIFAFTMLITSCKQAYKKDSLQNLNKMEKQEMNLSENKTLVVDFIEAMQNSNTEKLKTMIIDDFSLWIIGKPEYLATAGEHDTEYFLGFFKGKELFPNGAGFKTISIIAEGNKVAAEAEFKAQTAMGSDYENYYHFLFIIENGKIKRMKEYMDTYHAKVTFGL